MLLALLKVSYEGDFVVSYHLLLINPKANQDK